jgi:hypothetical protein
MCRNSYHAPGEGRIRQVSINTGFQAKSSDDMQRMGRDGFSEAAWGGLGSPHYAYVIQGTSAMLQHSG